MVKECDGAKIRESYLKLVLGRYIDGGLVYSHFIDGRHAGSYAHKLRYQRADGWYDTIAHWTLCHDQCVEFQKLFQR